METLKSLTKPLNGSAGEERSFRSFGSVPYCIGDGSLTKLTVFCCSLYSFSFLFDLCLGLCLTTDSQWYIASNQVVKRLVYGYLSNFRISSFIKSWFSCNIRFQTVKFNYILSWTVASFLLFSAQILVFNHKNAAYSMWHTVCHTVQHIRLLDY